MDYDHVLENEPTEVSADEFVEHWRETIRGSEVTHHLSTNHRVGMGDNETVCTAYFQAQHFYPENCGDSLWTLGGHYRFGLGWTEDSWQIEELIMTGLWAGGNQFLLERANERSTLSLPTAVITTCRSDVRFVAFRPVKIVTLDSKPTDVSSISPIFCTSSPATDSTYSMLMWQTT
jgi:hypothetical protein